MEAEYFRYFFIEIPTAFDCATRTSVYTTFFSGQKLAMGTGDGEEGGPQKTHRKRQAGPKAERKKSKVQHEQELSAKQRNPKAFSYQSVNKVSRAVRR